MAFDPTTLNLIVAGDEAGAITRLDAGHPNELLVTMGATIERAAAQLRATSTTSITIGAGPFVFTIAEGNLSWRQGDQVVIRDAIDPDLNFMNCSLTADQDSGTGDITVSVDSSTGSGTFTSWELLLTVFILAATVSPPFTLTQGGLGTDASTPAGVAIARANLEVPRMVIVAGAVQVLTSEPAGTYLALDGATGNLAGLDHRIIFWDGAVVTGSEIPSDGDFTLDSDELWIFSDTLGTQERVGGIITDPTIEKSAGLAPLTLTADSWDIGTGGRGAHLILYVTGGAVDLFITIPDAITLPAPARRVTIRNKSGSSKKVNVTGGGTIDASSEVSIADNATAEFGVFSPDDSGPPVVPEWTQLS